MDMIYIILVLPVLLLIICLILMIVSLKKSIKEISDGVTEGRRESGKIQDIKFAEQNEKINEINRQLNDTMMQVSKSLGEMRNLSSGVDDLKKLMTNVKSRGIMGELQLEAILEDLLAPSQYDRNVAVKGGSERVEFAVKFPSDDNKPIYLPIDSKFPGDAYLRLIDAYDTGDRALIKKASDNLKYAIVKAARDINTKYIYPPLTTDFAIMFLPFEGLYAEVLRMNIVELLQNEYRINIAGPTTMAAMLNSFRLGFKSLALQSSTGEVWETLERAKTEFAKFGEALDRTQRRLEQSQSELESLVGVRTRGIQKALEKVSISSEEETNVS